MGKHKKVADKRRRPRRRRSKSSSSSSSSSSGDTRTEQRRKIRRLEKKLSKLRKDNTRMITNPTLNIAVNETIIPIFDPSVDHFTAFEWSRKVDELIKYHKWDDLTATKLATSRLRGNARKWYDSLRQPCLTWNDVKRLLIKSFPHRVKFGKLLVEAASYIPGINQNLGDYCFEKVSKLKQLNLRIPEEYLIDSVIEGLGNETLCLSARAANFKSVGELANYLSQAGTSKPHHNGNSKGNYSGESKNNFVKFDKRHQYTKDREGQKEQKKNIMCFNCKGNHRVAECDKPKVECKLCHKLGHRQEQCFLVTRKKTKQVDQLAVSVSKQCAATENNVYKNSTY